MTNEEAIVVLQKIKPIPHRGDSKSTTHTLEIIAIDMAIKALEQQPEPEIKPIGYRECSNAMLKMWMDNVLTDGEYNRIMDKLNAKWEKILESEAKNDDNRRSNT